MVEIECPKPEEVAEIKEKTFTRRVALLTAAYAVALALTALGGSNASKEMLLNQQKASNAWAYYQAKAMREHLYGQHQTLLELDLLERGATMSTEAKAAYVKRLDQAKAEVERYRQEKKGVEEQARQHEAETARNQAKDPYFDFGEGLLQIAIIMASIAMLATSRPALYLSLAAGGLGVFLGLNGFLMLLPLPFLH